MGSSTASGSNRAQEAIMKALDSPLLNDNKITGAKNVLLLIVSGSQEITIDEIGEINDHIQNEAGHSANIIMGVGEDEGLGEAIAVTIIATGFNVDQQNEITNTETKKVVHSLEDDQTMEQDLSEKDPAIITPDIVLEKKEEKIVHTLVDDLLDEMDIVSTTKAIRNIEVVVEEDAVDEDFIIQEVTPTKSNNEENDEIFEDQTILTFDLPLSTPEKEVIEPEESESVVFELEDDVKDISVNDYVELVTITESSEKGETRYTLDDHVVAEETQQKKQAGVAETQTEEDLVFEKKVVEKQTEESAGGEDLDPVNSPISELLVARADERRRKMKEFNYKFNNAKIDEIEKEPAYKRQGIDLDDVQHSSETNTSRLSVGLDDNDEVQLRSNNSFLHDNVD